MSRNRIVGVTVGAAVLVLVACGLTCRRDRDTEAPEAARVERARDDDRSLDDERSRGDHRERDDAPATSRPETDVEERSSGSTFARVSAGRSQHDLRLLADVQRELDAPAPDSVKALLERRDAGASREELAREIDEHVEGMLVQAACRRWLAREFSAPPPSTIGSGGRDPAVKPLRRREQ